MNISENRKLEVALETFEFSLNEITNITKDNLKKQYHKLSLKWHPDKNATNSEESTQKFQQISESYAYLLRTLFNDDEGTTNGNTNYPNPSIQIPSITENVINSNRLNNFRIFLFYS